MSANIDNPYQAPQANITPADSETTRIRTRHIKHEATIRSIGMLFYIGSVLAVIAGAGMTISGFSEASTKPSIIGAVFILIGIIQFWVGRKLRELSPQAKIPTTILSTLGLLGFPVGTLVNLYILYVIHCKKGRYILSDEYREIVEATPEIKYQTSILIWMFLGLIVLGIVAAIIIPAMH